MIAALAWLFQPRYIEMLHDVRFARRLKRLAATAAVALALIYYLASRAGTAPPAVRAALLLGWLLMPTILIASLRRPALRYALAIPSLLVGVALLALLAALPPGDKLQLTGWASITLGIWLGAAMGMWFWYRWFPVPSAFHDPFSSARWLLIALHVGFIVSGGLVVAVAQALPGA